MRANDLARGFYLFVRRTTLLLSLMLSVTAWARGPRPQARIGELLIAADSIEQLNKLEDGSVPRSGFHFIHVSGTISNVGKHAICTSINGWLETTFNLQYYATRIHLDDSPVLGAVIHQMLPGEQASVDFVFEVKDGVEPAMLVVKQGKYQGCSVKERLPVTNPQARIPTSAIEKVKQ